MTIDLSGADEAATFGPPLPSASDATDSPPPGVAAALDRMQARDDGLFIATSLADLAARHGTALRQAEAGGTGTADGFATGVDDAFMRDVDGIVARTSSQPGPRPSDAALDLFRRQANGLRQSLVGRAAVQEESLRRQQQMRSVAAALDGLHGLVAADPGSLHEATTRLDGVIGAATPLVGEQAAAQWRDVESRRLVEAAVNGIIADDPAAALKTLSSGVLDGRLDEAAKARLVARATMRDQALSADAERASANTIIVAEQAQAARSFQMKRDLGRRIADGQATHADIADAEASGALTGAEAARMRDQLAETDRARAAETVAAAGVAQALSDGRSFDPLSTADRAAVDAHWRTAAAPALATDPAPAAARVITDYVGAVGIAPSDAIRRLTEVCFGADPADRVAAARALGDCLRIDPQAGDALPPEIRDAVLRTASLADAGLPADKAVAPLDRVDLTAISRSADASAGEEIGTTTVESVTDAGDAADTATARPRVNAPIPPPPAYKRDAVPDADWVPWIGALVDAGLSDTQQRVYGEIFAAEGGSKINPRNGAKSGIIQETLERLVSHGLLPSVPSGTRSRDLTYEQRVEAYRAYLDNAFQHVTGKSAALDSIGDFEAAAALADTLFRHGGARPANRVVQNAINDVAPGRVAADGVLRNDTVAAYGELARDPATKRALLDALAERRKEALKDEAIKKLKREAIKQNKSPDEVDTKDVHIDSGELKRVKHFRFPPEPSQP